MDKIKNLHIENSYKVWLPSTMEKQIYGASFLQYKSLEPDKLLNRYCRGMYIEWYLHNFGYWFTLPFIKKPNIAKLNERFKHLDLEEHL